MLKIAVFLVVVAVTAAVTTYEGHKVYRLNPSTDAQIQFLEKATSANIGISLWTPLKKGQVDVMVSPKANYLFHLRLKELKITHQIIMEDVQKVIDTNRIQNDAAKLNAKDSTNMDHTSYKSLDEINAELDKLISSYPNLFSDNAIGQTAKGRDIRVMKVSSDGKKKESVFIDCGLHSHEWIAPATCLYILDNLSNYDTDTDVTALLDLYNFYVIVTANPDGYQYSWYHDRMWRKNRVNNGDDCYGVDLNRNFDFHFGEEEGGLPDKPCSEVYRGPSAFSEAESRACRDTILGLGARVKVAFSIHSYSQYWMIPFAYTNDDLPAEYDEMERVANIGSAALTAVYNTRYTVGSDANIFIYPTSGVSTDWYYDAGIIYSYHLEIRDAGTYGFLLPADRILPTGEETWIGMKAAISAVPL